VVQLTHELDYTGGYANTFTAVLHSLPQPPANPYARPQPGVPELAEVIDVADPQRLGRVRVRYYWPVAKPTSAETDWVRVLTPYAGDGKGQLFTPEVGSQVLMHYQQQRPEQPLVLGNLFHAQNKQGAKYTNPVNNLKGMQTAGGNKFVMSDVAGQQRILISNSNNKGTSVEVGFQGDGSVTIKSNGPVTVLSPNITLEAGNKGSITLHAKTISMTAEEAFTLDSKSQSIALTAKQDISAEATQNMNLKAKAKTVTATDGVTISGGTQVDIKAGKVKVNS
jgi:type VI secretion system secreted protein VgrG